MQNDRPSWMLDDTLLGDVPAKSHELRDLLGYWDAMRGQDDVPRREDIDPRRIEPLLAHAFIAERIAPGQSRLRIAGSHLRDLMGMEVRGMPVSCFVEPGSRAQLADRTVELFDAPALVRFSLRAAGTSGTLLMLPLRSDLGDISRALGCLVTGASAAPPPRRFEISASRVLRVGRDRQPVADGLSEPAEGFQHGTRHPSERPWLRVVK
ncbi:MAG: PAS domain-containing protein [Roseovarius sp.]|nr:PAS domain-containing protein [Roseovarius sp.]